MSLKEIKIEKAEIVKNLNGMPEALWGSDRANRLQERLAVLEDRLPSAGN